MLSSHFQCNHMHVLCDGGVVRFYQKVHGKKRWEVVVADAECNVLLRKTFTKQDDAIVCFFQLAQIWPTAEVDVPTESGVRLSGQMTLGWEEVA